MTRLRIYFRWLPAGLLSACAALQAQAHSLSDALKQDSTPPAALSAPRDGSFEQATGLMQQGKNDEALALLESIAAAEPARRGVLRQIGIANYRKGDFVKAAASLKKALDEDPRDDEAVQLMGLSYYLAGRPAEAIAPLEKVQAWDPSANVDAAYILGVCYIQTKDYPNPRKAFAKIVAVPADSAAGSPFKARIPLRQTLRAVCGASD